MPAGNRKEWELLGRAPLKTQTQSYSCYHSYSTFRKRLEQVSFALLYNPTWDSEIAQGRFGVRHPANWGLGITSSTQTSQDSTVAVSRVGPRTIDGPSLN